jgi:hypothetical protein
MQQYVQLVAFCDSYRRMLLSPPSLSFVKQFWDEDAAFWAREMDVDDSMSMGRRLETGLSMSL